MENFDDLSNDQLRLKMLEYGMPNMPITATTRKLVVKKLKNYIENANSKTRRDTIHVTKFSSDDDTDTAEEPKKAQKKESSRRATIGGSAAKLSKTLPVMPDLPPPKAAAKTEKAEPVQKRRSGRITPVQGKDDAPAVAVPKEPMIVENSSDEEDEDMLPLTQKVRRDRKSKSPSLSRAEMVTTSYIHQVEVASKEPIVETMEIDLTESTDEVVVEPEPVPEPKTRPQVTPSRESRYNTTSTSTTTSKRTTIGGGFTATTPSRQSELSSSFGRPSMSTVYSSPRTETRRDEIALEPTDSPYLSEFTKRLSRLKAENAQLNAVKDHPIRRTIASSYAATRGADGDYVSSRLAAVRGQRPTGKQEGEIRASIRQVILSLDQKYSIRKMFYLLIVAMIVIFLFVFFFL